jgi:hypothetical protein
VLRFCRVEEAGTTGESGLGLGHGVDLLIVEEVENMGHNHVGLRRLEFGIVAEVRSTLSGLRTDFIKSHS